MNISQERCRARVKALCPRHGNKPKSLPQIEDFFGKDVIGDVQLKDMSHVRLGHTIIAEVQNIPGIRPKRVLHAIEVASYLHRNDMRSNRGVLDVTPYIEHPLRNTLRVLRWDCTKESVLVATILHDTVEDHAFEISAEMCGKTTTNEMEARENAFQYVGRTFGSDVERIVRGMSNPIMDRYAPAAERNNIYAEHVKKEIQDPDVFVSKFSDFCDNGLGLHHNVSHMKPVSVKKKATKYLLLIDAFTERLKNGQDLPISEQSRLKMLKQLEVGSLRLEKLSNIEV